MQITYITKIINAIWLHNVGKECDKHIKKCTEYIYSYNIDIVNI